MHHDSPRLAPRTLANLRTTRCAATHWVAATCQSQHANFLHTFCKGEGGGRQSAALADTRFNESFNTHVSAFPHTPLQIAKIRVINFQNGPIRVIRVNLIFVAITIGGATNGKEWTLPQASFPLICLPVHGA